MFNIHRFTGHTGNTFPEIKVGCPPPLRFNLTKPRPLVVGFGDHMDLHPTTL